MAQRMTLWDIEEDGKYVVIWNQHSQRYSTETWEYLKNKHTLTDQELAEVLNNMKP